MENTNSIEELGIKITNKLENGCKLYELQYLLESYVGIDWSNHVEFSDDKYKKIIEFRNDLIDIIIICWNTNQSSGIHDHPSNGCLLRIMDGRLTENVYVNNDCLNEKFKLSKTKKLNENQISFIQGKNGLHNISNIGDIKTVSLHVYSPPNYTPNFFI